MAILNTFPQHLSSLLSVQHRHPLLQEAFLDALSRGIKLCKCAEAGKSPAQGNNGKCSVVAASDALVGEAGKLPEW